MRKGNRQETQSLRDCVSYSSEFDSNATPDAVSKRLSKTAFRAAFMMAGVYFSNYMGTVFSETDYWKTIQGRTRADKAMLS